MSSDYRLDNVLSPLFILCCILRLLTYLLKLLYVSPFILHLLQQLYKDHGGVLLDQHQVTDILPGPVVTVVTSKATFKTKRLVVTAGPWAPQLLRKTGLELPFMVNLELSKSGITLFNIRVHPSFSRTLTST